MIRQPWTPEALVLLTALYPDNATADIAKRLGCTPNRVYAKANALGLRKSAAYFTGDRAGRIQRGRQDPRMVASQFRPGTEPWNKGLAWDSGGRSHETRFKRGQMSGAAHMNWVPVGTYRVNSYGVLDRKTTDLGRGPRDWEAVARLVWKAANGPIPDKHIIVFKPGRKSTVLELITPDAVECISRAENAQRNHPRNKSPELSKLYQLKGAITRQVNRITKEAAQAAESTAL
jgi:hypothetical protein